MLALFEVVEVMSLLSMKYACKYIGHQIIYEFTYTNIRTYLLLIDEMEAIIIKSFLKTLQAPHMKDVFYSFGRLQFFAS